MCLVQAQIAEIERLSVDKNNTPQLTPLFCGVAKELSVLLRSGIYLSFVIELKVELDVSFYLELVGNKFKQYFTFWLYYAMSYTFLHTGIERERYLL